MFKLLFIALLLYGCGIVDSNVLRVLDQEDITGEWLETIEDTIWHSNGNRTISDHYNVFRIGIDPIGNRNIYDPNGRIALDPISYNIQFNVTESGMDGEAKDFIDDWHRTVDGLRYYQVEALDTIEFIIPTSYLNELFPEGGTRARVDSLYILDYNTKDTLHKIARIN